MIFIDRFTSNCSQVALLLIIIEKQSITTTKCIMHAAVWSVADLVLERRNADYVEFLIGHRHMWVETYALTAVRRLITRSYIRRGYLAIVQPMPAPDWLNHQPKLNISNKADIVIHSWKGLFTAMPFLVPASSEKWNNRSFICEIELWIFLMNCLCSSIARCFGIQACAKCISATILRSSA